MSGPTSGWHDRRDMLIAELEADGDVVGDLYHRTIEGSSRTFRDACGELVYQIMRAFRFVPERSEDRTERVTALLMATGKTEAEAEALAADLERTFREKRHG